jgi:ribosome-associated protein
MTQPVTSEDSKLPPPELARRAAILALEKKAKDVVTLDLRELTSMCDFFVIASGESEPQIRAIVEHVEAGLAEGGERPWHVEGLDERKWVLLDYVDVVVHVFHEQARDVYMLERLWGDAPREVVDAGAEGP